MIAVLDMGATAVRLVIADVGRHSGVRVIEEVSRGVLLGRDTFSTGVIRAQTADATLTALEGFRRIIDSYPVRDVQAVATSAVREARNGDMFLDRVRGRTGIAFDIINEAEESRLVYLAVRDVLRNRPSFARGGTLLAEVGGGSTSLTLLRDGQPNRSGVYALGAIRLRQQLDLQRHGSDLQVALLNRSIENVIAEIRLEIPLRRVKHVVAIGGDVRFAASQIQDVEGEGGIRDIPRQAFLTFCDDIASLDEERLSERFRLPAVELETLVPALLVYRAIVAATAAAQLLVCDASLRAGVILSRAEPGGRRTAREFERQVLASAEALGQRYRYDRAHGWHVAKLATRLFDELAGEHGLGERERLLLKVAALLHDVGIYVSLRAHHKHSQYLLAAVQIFGLSDEETLIVSNVARYHRRGTPQRGHLPYVALDRQARVIVNKLGAMLRVANALDAEHRQKIRDFRLLRRERSWILELEGRGDLTMEQMAATARADMFAEVFGRQLVFRPAGGQDDGRA